MKKIYFLLSTILFFNFVFAQEQKPDYTEALNLIDRWLEAQIDYDRLPGLSVGIVKDQELIWSKGYGKSDIEKNTDASAATIYSICSISKLFTSVAIMKLYDEGKIRLDDEVSKILPWFNIQQQYQNSGPITIRTLLTHSSGLPRESDFPYWSPDFDFPTKEQLKSKLKEQQTLYPASTSFQYSNLGISLLGFVVEAVSGMSYEKYIEDNILKALRLSETRTFLPENLWRGKLATGYSTLNRKGQRIMMPFFKTEGITAAAGFSSNVEDLARFASWQFRLLKKGGNEILKSSTLHTMHNVHWMDPDWKTSWGLGFVVSQVEGIKMVGHGGYCPGYQTLLMLNTKDQSAYIVMINAVGVNPNKYFMGMMQIMSKVINKDTKENITINFEDYTGTYDTTPYTNERIVFSWQGKLAMLSLPSDSPQKDMVQLKHLKGDTFNRIREDGSLGEEIVFERDASKKVIQMWQHSNYRKKIK